MAILLWVSSLVEALPQPGQIVFNNRVLNAVVAPVYNADPSDLTLAKHGNTALGTPAGTQIYSGAPLAGHDFTAQLFGGPADSEPKDLVALIPATTFRTGDGAGFVVPPASALTVPGVAEGQSAKLQLRVWNNGGGSCTDWLQLLGDPSLLRGESLPFLSAPLGGLFVVPPNLVGLESFNLALGVNPATDIRLSGQFQPNPAGFRLSFRGLPGGQYEIQATTNFFHWDDRGAATISSNDWFHFLDVQASGSPLFFYRIKAP